MDLKKIEYLVVDTGAFIKNASIQDLAENVITCQEVIDEITSKRQLRRLVVLPYELQIKDVFPENVKFVTEFSKKTGDYPSLSATDIKVIALTYQLEKEKVGSNHLREAPEAAKTITFQSHPTVDPKDVAGFYIPSKGTEGEREGNKEAGNKAQNNVSEEPSDTPDEKFASLQCTEDADEGKNEVESDDSDDEELETNEEEEVGNGQTLDEVDPSMVFVKVQDSKTSTNAKDGEADNSNSEEGEESPCESEDDDDDDDGWITPGNISQAKKQMNAEFEDEKPVTVACITTDFAMQNVLKQIGLHVSSVDGRVIKQLRTFILRCYACFKITSIMTKVFCPNCGHKTLKRVAVSVEPDGSQKIHINLKKPLTCRGKKFSLPTFQGGKHANNPILFEDQPVPDQRPSRVARSKTNILDADYIPGFSPFAMRDTTSKSAMLGIRGNREIKHWMRRNPNEAKPHSGRKKK